MKRDSEIDHPDGVGLESHADPKRPLNVLAAWNPESNDKETLHVAAWLGRSTSIRVRVVTTFIQPWGSPAIKKRGKKFKKWFHEESAAISKLVDAELDKEGIGKNARAKKFSVFMAGSNRAQLLTDAAAKFNADLILLPAKQSAPKNRIFAGSTADTLLHYSPVTLGLTPRGVKLSKHGVTRINFAFTSEHGDGDDPALYAAAVLASRMKVPLRILAFSPSGLVGSAMTDTIDVSKELNSEWRERSLGLLDVARDTVSDTFPGLDVSTDVGVGSGWQGAVDSLKWKKGDLVMLGSHPMGAFSRVFLGSKATELLPHLSVPVIVHPVAQ